MTEVQSLQSPCYSPTRPPEAGHSSSTPGCLALSSHRQPPHHEGFKPAPAPQHHPPGGQAATPPRKPAKTRNLRQRRATTKEGTTEKRPDRSEKLPWSQQFGSARLAIKTSFPDDEQSPRGRSEWTDVAQTQTRHRRTGPARGDGPRPHTGERPATWRIEPDAAFVRTTL